MTYSLQPSLKTEMLDSSPKGHTSKWCRWELLPGILSPLLRIISVYCSNIKNYDAIVGRGHIYVHLCVHAYMWTGAHSCGDQRTTSLVTFRTSSTLFSELGLLRACSLPSRQCWLSNPLYWLFNMSSWNLTQTLTLARQALYWLGHLPGPFWF